VLIVRNKAQRGCVEYCKNHTPETTMNDKIRKHLQEALEKEGIKIEEVGENWYEVLTEFGKEVYSESVGKRRWWEDIFKVVEIDGMLIGYRDAVTTGDDSTYDKGWEFEEGSVCEVERKQEMKLVVTYEKKRD